MRESVRNPTATGNGRPGRQVVVPAGPRFEMRRLSAFKRGSVNARASPGRDRTRILSHALTARTARTPGHGHGTCRTSCTPVFRGAGRASETCDAIAGQHATATRRATGTRETCGRGEGGQQRGPELHARRAEHESSRGQRALSRSSRALLGCKGAQRLARPPSRPRHATAATRAFPNHRIHPHSCTDDLTRRYHIEDELTPRGTVLVMVWLLCVTVSARELPPTQHTLPRCSRLLIHLSVCISLSILQAPSSKIGLRSLQRHPHAPRRRGGLPTLHSV